MAGRLMEIFVIIRLFVALRLIGISLSVLFKELLEILEVVPINNFLNIFWFLSIEVVIKLIFRNYNTLIFFKGVSIFHCLLLILTLQRKQYKYLGNAQLVTLLEPLVFSSVKRNLLTHQIIKFHSKQVFD